MVAKCTLSYSSTTVYTPCFRKRLVSSVESRSMLGFCSGPYAVVVRCFHGLNIYVSVVSCSKGTLPCDWVISPILEK